MAVITEALAIKMKGHGHIENITGRIQERVQQSGLRAGIATIFVQHTTASVLIIEDEPGLREDTKTLWDRLVPENPGWKHNTYNPGETNGHSHLRGQMQGASLSVPFVNAELALGAWQQIIIIDFDTRERTRQLVVQMLGE